MLLGLLPSPVAILHTRGVNWSKVTSSTIMLSARARALTITGMASAWLLLMLFATVYHAHSEATAPKLGRCVSRIKFRS